MGIPLQNEGSTRQLGWHLYERARTETRAQQAGKGRKGLLAQSLLSRGGKPPLSPEHIERLVDGITTSTRESITALLEQPQTPPLKLENVAYSGTTAIDLQPTDEKLIKKLENAYQEIKITEDGIRQILTSPNGFSGFFDILDRNQIIEIAKQPNSTMTLLIDPNTKEIIACSPGFTHPSPKLIEIIQQNKMKWTISPDDKFFTRLCNGQVGEHLEVFKTGNPAPNPDMPFGIGLIAMGSMIVKLLELNPKLKEGSILYQIYRIDEIKNGNISTTTLHHSNFSRALINRLPRDIQIRTIGSHQFEVKIGEFTIKITSIVEEVDVASILPYFESLGMLPESNEG